MRKLITLFAFVFTLSVNSFAQSTAYRVFSRSSLPATCSKTTSSVDVVIITTTNDFYICSGGNVWKLISQVAGSGAANRVAYWSGSGTLTSNSNFTFDGSLFTIPSGGIGIKGVTSGTVTHRAADSTTNYTVKWPSSQGGVNTFLKNDGSGNLSWNTVSNGGSGEQLIATVTIDLNTTTAQDIYTSTGNFITTRAVLRETGGVNLDDGSTTNVQLVRSNDSAILIQFNVVGSQDYLLATIAASTGRIVTNGNKIQAKPNVAFGSAANAIVDVFGYYF